MPPDEGASGDAQNLLLKGHKPAEVLARESIQNSVDAISGGGGGGQVQVSFDFRILRGDDKRSFVADLGLVASFARGDGENPLGLPHPSDVADLSNPAQPLYLLNISDRGTTGLEGDPAEGDSNYTRFVKGLGDGKKTTGGGSFGFGKTVFSGASRLRRILVLNRTVENLTLIGVGMHAIHKQGGKRFPGRAFWGVEAEDGSTQPLGGPAAEALAQSLGFKREGNGLTVVVIEPTVKPEDVVCAVEDYWWPAIVDGSLLVRVDGKAVNPSARLDLHDYIRAYRLARGETSPSSQDEMSKSLSKTPYGEFGRLGAVRVPDAEESPDATAPTNCVALIRKARMVVQYHRATAKDEVTGASGFTPKASFVGAFVASDRADAVYRMSEPFTHDKWEKDEERIQKADQANGLMVVNQTPRSIRTELKAWIKSAVPPPPPSPDRLEQLDEILKPLLRKAKRGKPKGPEPRPSVLSYETLTEATRQAVPGAPGTAKVVLARRVWLNEHSEEDFRTFVLDPRAFLLGDAQLRRLDARAEAIQVAVTMDGADLPEDRRLTLRKDAKIRIEWTTEPFDARFSVDLDLGLVEGAA